MNATARTIKTPTEYHTPAGLYRASLHVIENLSGPRRLSWMLSALEHAETTLNCPDLRDAIAQQFRERAGLMASR